MIDLNKFSPDEEQDIYHYFIINDGIIWKGERAVAYVERRGWGLAYNPNSGRASLFAYLACLLIFLKTKK